MKNIFLIGCYTFAFCLFLSHLTYSQAGEWTWMKGSNSSGATGVFGTQGVADPANTPPALYGAGPFTDKAGNFWMFGGYNNNSYTALWKYEPATNNWTWMKGPGTVSQYGVYGTLGVADINNYPGSRAYGFPTWVDTSGNFWLYGGTGYSSNTQGYLSDLWKYDVATNQWIWMNGSNNNTNLLPVYGTKGVPAATNSPGGRFETTCGWTDSQNRLWFFGGYDGALDLRDDVWMYDIGTNEWTWMAGSNIQNQVPNWGTQGTFNATNTPGARCAYTHWKDADDNLWTFGGGYPSNIFADLWKYDITLNQWAWISGVNYANYFGIQGPTCDLSIYSPTSRAENRCSWVDCCGKFWLLGGGDGNGDPSYNDLWFYDPAVNKWSWINGDSTANPVGYYGTQGLSSPANKPRGKIGISSWIDDQQNLWLFGGASVSWTTPYNDVWRYIRDTTCHGCSLSCSSASVQSVAFSSSDSFLCEKFCINFYDSSQSNPIAWQWIFPGGSPSSSTDQNPVSICYQTPGVFDVTLITTNANGNDTLTLYNYITVYPTPPFPTITQVGYTLTSSPASSYQWQFNSVDIPGATNQSYTILQTGYYTVIISDENGCVNSLTEYVLISGIDDVISDGNISIYPNPSSGKIMVEWVNGLMAEEVSIDVVNTLGQIIFSSTEPQSIGTASFSEGVHSDKIEIDLSHVARGVYFIEIKTENEYACPDFFGVWKKILIAE